MDVLAVQAVLTSWVFMACWFSFWVWMRADTPKDARPHAKLVVQGGCYLCLPVSKSLAMTSSTLAMASSSAWV
jgi:hypothetical protein